MNHSSSCHVDILRPKRIRDASNRRRGGWKVQKKMQNQRLQEERDEYLDRTDQALEIMGSLARSLERVINSWSNGKAVVSYCWTVTNAIREDCLRCVVFGAFAESGSTTAWFQMSWINSWSDMGATTLSPKTCQNYWEQHAWHNQLHSSIHCAFDIPVMRAIQKHLTQHQCLYVGAFHQYRFFKPGMACHWSQIMFLQRTVNALNNYQVQIHKYCSKFIVTDFGGLQMPEAWSCMGTQWINIYFITWIMFVHAAFRVWSQTSTNSALHPRNTKHGRLHAILSLLCKMGTGGFGFSNSSVEELCMCILCLPSHSDNTFEHHWVSALKDFASL